MKAVDKQPQQLAPSWDLVAPSWRLLVKYYEPVIFLFILPSLLLVLGSLLLGDTRQLHHVHDINHRQHIGIGLMGLSVVWSIINYGPSLFFRLQAAGGKQINLLNCYRKGLKFFWRLVGLNLLIGAVILVGLLLFIIPGLFFIYLFVKRYYLSAYYLVDRNLGIWEALHASHEETADYTPAIWGLIGVQISFSLLAGIVSSVTRVGSVAAIFIQLVCLFLPVLRYREIKAVQRHGKK
jgi:hypothetical protein